MTIEISATGLPYQIVSIQSEEAPAGMDGPDWYHYVIAQGNNTINGYRQGNLKAVTFAVEEIVVRLNERRIGKRSRVNPVPAPTTTTRK